MARVSAIALLVVLLPLGDARRVLSVSHVMSQDHAENEALCSATIVDQTCFEINGGIKHDRGDDWTQTTQIRDLLSADEETMGRLWDAIQGPTEHPTSDGQGYWISCDSLCHKVVAYAQANGICPQESDRACYVERGQEPDCTLDVGLSAIPTFGPGKDVDLPDMHDKPMLTETDPNISGSLFQALGRFGEASKANSTADIIDYDLWETVERVANLFRVYPSRKASLDEAGVESLMESSGHAFPSGYGRVHAQKEAEAKAYMGIVIRAINAKRTRTQMTRWFGSRAYTDPRVRREILRVLNSVDHMISNVEPMYPGPECSDNTYAYVYPRAHTCSYASELATRACTKLGSKFVFYLCPLYLKRPTEMIETLVHEGSHHATSYTDDVEFEGNKAYGRSPCQRVASRDPSKAIKNADNFCYYIQDVATEVADNGGGGRGSSSARCLDGSYADGDGDCRCPPEKSKCYQGGYKGCIYSEGTRALSYYKASCSNCRCSSY